jgi:hypothetical protein
MLAHQRTSRNSGIGNRIEAMGAQQFQRLIERGMAGFSFHEGVPV